MLQAHTDTHIYRTSHYPPPIACIHKPRCCLPFLGCSPGWDTQTVLWVRSRCQFPKRKNRNDGIQSSWSSGDRLLAGTVVSKERSCGLGLGSASAEAESLRVATPAVHAQPGSQLPHSCRSDQPACSPSAMTFSHLRPHLEVARPLQAAPPAPKLFPPIPLTFEGTRGYFAPSSTTDPGDRCSSTQVWDLPSVQRWEKVGKVASQRHHLSRPALRLTFLCAREVADL